ncbi:hypothetical protein DPM19_05995 [Actinomadura craniellae]|uniref:DUF3140 domain-containing protein n=1 Tax=Actinomadura craniellae TaxID=2231787 RepID=A0A365HBM5_9ACTN|nr:DUF3140 domain-containing protein [Actinomadura craniellae]RAY16422.1 hypothetical protein DPM19_05995 [Actinomadura craniellae]
MRTSPEVDSLWDRFHRVVNMSSHELRAWLLTDASGEKAFTADPDLHLPDLGRRVVHVLNKRKGDLTDEDTATMRRVVGFVSARLGSPPPAGAGDEHWRHALMTVGHDPLKPSRASDIG